MSVFSTELITKFTKSNHTYTSLLVGPRRMSYSNKANIALSGSFEFDRTLVTTSVCFAVLAQLETNTVKNEL